MNFEFKVPPDSPLIVEGLAGIAADILESKESSALSGSVIRNGKTYRLMLIEEHSNETNPGMHRASGLMRELCDGIEQHGDLIVRMYADHGQEKLGLPAEGSVGLGYAEKSESRKLMPDLWCEEDFEDDPDLDKDKTEKQFIVYSIA